MSLVDRVLQPLPFAEVWDLYKPGMARQKILSALNSASESLGDVGTALRFTEFFADPEIGEVLANYSENVHGFAEKLSLPDTMIKNFQSAMKITQAVSGLKGKISDNPQAAAKAFGKLFSGIGELAKYFPFPGVDMYFELFAGAEDFFENIRVKTQPEVHMSEPGIRETIDRL